MLKYAAAFWGIKKGDLIFFRSPYEKILLWGKEKGRSRNFLSIPALAWCFFGYVMLLRWFESLQGFSTSFKNVTP